MRTLLSVVLALALTTSAGVSLADEGSKSESRRAEIDAMAASTLETLFAENPDARALFDAAHGYAVFQNLKIALGLSGGGGAGVAVLKSNGHKTYMKMGTAGIGFGLGGKKYQIVFIFESEKIYRNFIDKGWQADTTANAVAGTAAVSAESTFTNGLKIYQITDAGLMAHAEVAGTKYWKYTKLN